MSDKINKILTVLSFFIPFLIYLLTMAPTMSFWDCGEYIATSVILGVPHPPGSPLYLLLGNFFSKIPIFSDIGARINLISPIASAFSVMFLYLIVVHLIEEYNGKTKTVSDILINYFSAFVAAMTFAVTDSHWYNAVEAEIYSLSTFFTSIVVWMILKWNNESKENNWNVRYLLIIAYLFGLATGLHLLNLLTLPFVALIIYFRKYTFKIKTFIITIISTLLVFVIIYIGIIKGLPDIANKTNSLIFVILCPLLILAALVLNNVKKITPAIVSTISILSICGILILLINALFIKGIDAISYDKYNKVIEFQTLIDLSDKEIYKMNELLQDKNFQNYEMQEKINSKIKNRNIIVDQYKEEYNNYLIFEKQKNNLNYLKLLAWQSKTTLLYIALFFATLIFLFFRYKNFDFNTTSILLNIFFSCVMLVLIGYSTYILIFIRSNQHPNINENSPDNLNRALAYMNRDQYGDWSILDLQSTLSRSENTNWNRYTADKMNPSTSEQFNFFINYQINEMYLRYFAWQFIGRGEKENYPWYIRDINGNLTGNQSLDGINWFRYGLPLAFIIGIIGLVFHFSQDWRRALAVLSLFLAMGLMIIVYLNQYDPQPRERDYSYVGSFFAFSIWIGIGLSVIQQKIKIFFEDSNISSFISISFITLTFILMPFKMFATDLHQHDRTGNYVAWDYGYNLLNSCEPHGIIFTNGDNDTFPLWYLQEVENIRKDVQVVNLSLLNTPWYIEQLINQTPKLDLQFKNEILKKDIYNIDPWIGTEVSFNLCGDDFEDKQWNELICNLPVEDSYINFKIRPTLIRKLLRVQDFLVLKIIQDIGTSRPIYFAATVSHNNQLGLDHYLQMEGMTYRLLFNKNQSQINYKKMKQNLIQADNDIIKTIDDYKNSINSNHGIYRYTNLNDSNIYFNHNIQRLVQNYRIGFIRLAEHKLSKDQINDDIEIESLLDSMNFYFPEKTLPIEPGIKMLISDSIYGELGNIKKQKYILKELIFDNIPIETKIYLLHKIAILEDQGLTIEMTKYLINNYSEVFDFELEKYIGDILSENLSQEEFKNFCFSIFEDNKFVGILYSLVRVLEIDNAVEEARKIVSDWVEEDPFNEELILLKDYLNNSNQLY